MIASVCTAALSGLEAVPVTVECGLSRGLPGVIMVGLAAKTVNEAKERMRSALVNSGLVLPPRKITLNLAPAALPKEGSGFDLPMALAILAASTQIEAEALSGSLVVGELALDGRLRPVRGIVAYAELAARLKVPLWLPHTNLTQASLVENATLLPFRTLREVYEHCVGLTVVKPARKRLTVVRTSASELPDLADIRGQAVAKRALEIAAAGQHNLLLDGPPGGGKTMLAQALISILPPLSRTELVEVTKLHSLIDSRAAVSDRPWRAPHHTASHIALVGGGRSPTPGEISLAHGGVLFLDELPEYPRPALESLRQPLESQTITVARAGGAVSFPADFMLVATSNPCPCGFNGDPIKPCVCPSAQLDRYRKKLSGPLLDRIDMVVRVSRVETTKLLGESNEEPSVRVATRVLAARERQLQRHRGLDCQTNARLPNRYLKELLDLHPPARTLLDQAAERLALTARGYVRTCKVARTIADLAGSEQIKPDHVAEALHYRVGSAASSSA